LGFALCDPKDIWMLATPFALKQLGCKNIIEACGARTKRFQGDPDLISMPNLLERGMGHGGMGY